MFQGLRNVAIMFDKLKLTFGTQFPFLQLVVIFSLFSMQKN